MAKAKEKAAAAAASAASAGSAAATAASGAGSAVASKAASAATAVKDAGSKTAAEIKKHTPESVKAFFAAPSIETLAKYPQLVLGAVAVISVARNPLGSVMSGLTSQAVSAAAASDVGKHVQDQFVAGAATAATDALMKNPEVAQDAAL